ncbi:Alpha/Beta hydrolase protein [Xylariales sp. PMI_506]|nr:Alpha/Beta hydrolase protein [Xylariales sp. PMI_506]
MPSISFSKVVLGLLAASACSATPSRRSTSSDCTSNLVFTNCDQYGYPSEFECGNLTVPIDYDHPDNGTLDLWVSRRRATGNETSLGVLLFNPGGPGGAASDVFAGLVQGLPAFSQAVLDSYDIIAVDPRGIGYSTPIQCDPDVWSESELMYATDQDSFDKLVAYNKAVGQSCETLTGPLLNFMDSISTVKDFEAVRKALKEDKISFLGFSYGTFLGQIYAALYPEQVGRFVLDGITNHAEAYSAGLLTEAATFEATLNQFFEWCDATTDCALHGQDVPTLLDTVTGPSASVPTVPGGPNATGEDILLSIQGGLVFVDLTTSWAELSVALNQTIFDNNATTLVSGDGNLNSAFSNRAVMCQDYGTIAQGPADLARIATVAKVIAPHTRGVTQNLETLAYCIGWPAPLSNPPRSWTPEEVEKMPQMLLVNSFYDPETSVHWALGVRDQIPQAVNIFRNGSGHSSYWLQGDTAAAMDEFFLTGTLPVDGTTYDS